MKARAFYARVPELFAASRPQWEKGYDELIYGIRRPLTRQNVHDVTAWLGEGPPLAPDARQLELVNTVLLRLRWPDVRPLARWKGIGGMTLPKAAALLHFHNPSFPSFHPGAVEGLALLGARVRRPAKLGLEELRAYRRHMDAIGELKEHIPFGFVPESHYFHVWVLEQALAEMARRGAP